MVWNGIKYQNVNNSYAACSLGISGGRGNPTIKLGKVITCARRSAWVSSCIAAHIRWSVHAQYDGTHTEEGLHLASLSDGRRAWPALIRHFLHFIPNREGRCSYQRLLNLVTCGKALIGSHG